MSELRSQPGEILDRVTEGESFIIERNGKQMACLVPLSVFLPDVSPSRIARELEQLKSGDAEAKATAKASVNEEREVTIQLATTVQGETFDLEVRVPHRYPSACPRVFVNSIPPGAPHTFRDGSLCIFGMTTAWNPGRHSLGDAVETSRQWLARYLVWRNSGNWPQLMVKNDRR